MMISDDARDARTRRRALLAEYATIVWNVFEGAASIAAGIAAASVALVAFGLDSTVEVFASAVVVWELHGTTRERERLALKLIGIAYLVVALYVAQDAVRSLWGRHHPSPSPAGIALTAATVVVMTALALLKLRIGRALDSATVLADARFSLVDAGLAGTVLVGLSLNQVFGWWWADQALALLLAVLAAREGLEELRGHA